ncbi:MAG: hypothetical protein AAF337_04690 [Pseudomonadota bacterium]
MTSIISRFIHTSILSVSVFLGPQIAAAQAPMEADPNRIALLWHRMTGSEPNIDTYVRARQEYTSAQEIDRERVYGDLVRAIMGDLSSVTPDNDTYVIRIGSQMSAYDPRAGGFFLPLFSGSSYVPIKAEGGRSYSRNKTYALGILGGGYQLHFINPDEFVFWPMPEAEARAFMAKVGQRPRVTARFVLDPLVAPSIPYIVGSERRIFGQVTKVELLDNRNNVLKTRSTALSTQEAKARGERIRLKPSKDVMAMMWHKIVGANELNREFLFDKRVSGSKTLYNAEDQGAYFDRFYANLDPTQPFTMLVAAEFSGYDAAKGEFPLKIDEPIQYESGFPGLRYGDDQARKDKREAGRRKPSFTIPRFVAYTKFSVDYSNEDAIGGLKTDPAGAARLRSDPSRSYNAQAQLTVVPIAAETLENFEKTNASKVLHTKIAKARIFDKATGQLLMEKTFDVAALARVPHETVPEGQPDFDGLDPYSIDFRGIKLGMTEAQMRAAAGYFREVRTSPKFAPGYMKLFAKGGESLGVTFCTDEKICSMSYSRRWQDEVVRDVYEATLEKYGQPVGGRAPYDTRGRGEAREASMVWTRNFSRVGGVDGRVSLVAGTTYLKMTAVDKIKTRKKKEKPKISLD